MSSYRACILLIARIYHRGDGIAMRFVLTRMVCMGT